MSVVPDWVLLAAQEIASVSLLTDEGIQAIIIKHCPFKPDIVYEEHREPPLLQCSDCHNTESCAGAMGRSFNHGRCLYCGGYFKVVRA